MRRCDPAGQPHGADAFVFGSEIGTKVEGFGRAWGRAVLRSHGVKVVYTETANLAPESRAALTAIDLHFHDLRREAGSRWLEGGMPLHDVRDLLGHRRQPDVHVLVEHVASLHEAMRAYEVACNGLHMTEQAANRGAAGQRGRTEQ